MSKIVTIRGDSKKSKIIAALRGRASGMVISFDPNLTGSYYTDLATPGTISLDHLELFKYLTSYIASRSKYFTFVILHTDMKSTDERLETLIGVAEALAERFYDKIVIVTHR